MHDFFSAWGGIVGRWPCLVLFVNLLVILMLVPASFDPVAIEDEREAWTPLGNQSIKDRKVIDALKLDYETQSINRSEYEKRVKALERARNS